MTLDSVETEVVEASPPPGGTVRHLRERLERIARQAPASWAWIGLGMLLIAGAVVLAYQTRGTTFWADEWAWILARRSGAAATFLHPHNQHLSLVPVSIYKLLFATVGLRHYVAYRAVLIAVDLACVLLVFIYVRRRVGGYMALLAGALILLFGPGWQDILWPFQIGWLIAVGTGVGALLMLDRRDRAGDIVAALLLAISLASAGPGLAIAVGVAVDVLARRRRRDVWIFLVPVALYALWWAIYQHAGTNKHALLLLPRFVFDAAAGALSSITGLASVDVYHDTGTYLTWGAPLLAIALAAMMWQLQRRGPRARVITLIAVLLSFWLLTGLGRAYVSLGPIAVTATGDESRYLYVSALFVLLLAAELLTGWRPAPLAAAVALVLVGAAVISNLGPLREATRLLQSQAQYTAAELETLDLSRPIVSPSYVSNGFIFGIVTAREWFAAKGDLGSPVSGQQVSSLPDYARQAADSQLIKIQSLALTAAPVGAVAPAGLAPPKLEGSVAGLALARGACVSFRPAVYTPSGVRNLLQITVPAAGVVLKAGNSPLAVSVGRFSTRFEALGTVAGSASAALRPRRDLSPAPWHLQIASDAPFSACDLG